MRCIVRASVVCVAAASVLSLAPMAGAVAPIKAGEHFIGLVNATHKAPVVEAVCPGPGGSKRFGTIASGQTMSVVHVAKGNGYTGLFDSVYAWFRPAAGGAAPTQLHFSHYSTPASIPTAIRVPCGGAGTVVFSSCPYLAPCAAGWVVDNVRVTFENIAT